MFLIDDIFKAIGARKQAGAQKEAWKDQQRYNTQAADFQTDKMHQKTQGIANLLEKLQPFIKDTTYSREGSVSSAGPDYRIDPELLKEKLATRVPVAPAGADPSKGATWNALGDMAGSTGNAAMTYFMGGFNKPKAQPAATDVAGLGTGGGITPFATGMEDLQFTAPTLR